MICIFHVIKFLTAVAYLLNSSNLVRHEDYTFFNICFQAGSQILQVLNFKWSVLREERVLI